METDALKGPRDVSLQTMSSDESLRTQAQDSDDLNLARLGKRPVLKRSFKFWAMLGFTTTVLTTWEGNIVAFQLAYEVAGPAGTIWAYVVVWFGMACIYLCLSELSSMAPTAGGQYHWVSILAPKSQQKFLSYITGWFTLTAWQATSASTAYNAGLTIAGLVSLCNPNYNVQPWHPTLIAWAAVLFAVFINTIATSALAKFEGLILILHVLGFFAILIPLVYFAPHNSPQDVFATFLNTNGWNNQTYAFFIGLSGSVYAFAGGDAAVHMAEEVRGASKLVPTSIMFSVTINGILGLGMLMAVLFCMGAPGSEDARRVLETELGFPFVQVFVDAVKSTAGAAVMTSIIMVLGISANVGQTATASRMFWSFARDRGLPMWRQLRRVDRRTSIPVMAVTVIAVTNALLCLIGIGSQVAFNDLVSISVVALLASYFVPLYLLLWKRTTGGIAVPSNKMIDEHLVNTLGSDLVWGPFRMPHVIGIVVNVIALIFTVVVFIFSFWPPAQPVTAASMNYSCLLFGGMVCAAIFWYIFHGRQEYVGPVVEITPDDNVRSPTFG